VLWFCKLIALWRGHCSTILQTLSVVLYLKYRSDSPPFARPGSSTKLKSTIICYSLLFLPISLVILWIPGIVQDNFGSIIILIALSFLFYGLVVIGAMLFALFQYVPPILTTVSLHTRGSISTIYLVLQIVMFVLLAVAQSLRFGDLTFRSSPYGPGLFEFYFVYGHMSLNYLLTALGQLALLVVCLIVDWGRLSGREKSGALKLVREEEQPLLYGNGS
jgi:hypothetical protein